ncbi:MAG: hypothetical protein HQK72_13185 [Desulfamplus sp.]|nr:hypothetical protein [Desulfamplus sp.]
MDDIVIQVEKIEAWFIKADYKQAYETLVILCKPYPDFDAPAKSILSRYNDLCKSVEMGVIPLPEHHIRKHEIANSYQMCMSRFKEHLKSCPICCIYEAEANSLTEHRTRIRKTEHNITKEYLECEDDKKIDILKKILREIKTVLKRFDNLLKYFTEVLNYERI